jgi:hypothetical protein
VDNLGFKVTVLADTSSDYSAIPRTTVEDARRIVFPLKVEVMSEPIMLNMTIGGEKYQTEVQYERDAHFSGDDHQSVGVSHACTEVHAWSATENCRTRNGPSVD